MYFCQWIIFVIYFSFAASTFKGLPPNYNKNNLLYLLKLKLTYKKCWFSTLQSHTLHTCIIYTLYTHLYVIKQLQFLYLTDIILWSTYSNLASQLKFCYIKNNILFAFKYMYTYILHLYTCIYIIFITKNT